MRYGLLTDDFNEALDGFLLEGFSCFLKLNEVVLKREKEGSEVAVVLTSKFLEEFPLDIIVMLVDLVDGFLAIFLNDGGVLLETEFRGKLSILNE
jgi:hypothetical protein